MFFKKYSALLIPVLSFLLCCAGCTDDTNAEPDWQAECEDTGDKLYQCEWNDEPWSQQTVDSCTLMATDGDEWTLTALDCDREADCESYICCYETNLGNEC